MISRYFTTIFFLIILYQLSAQTGELINLQNNISDKVSQVEGAKSNYSQHWTYNAEIPYRATLTVTEADKKNGKGKTIEYQFNLADLDENLVREETSRDLKSVTAGVSSKQKMVQVFEDGTQQNYEAEVSVLVSDSQEAEELKAMIREIIPLAKALDKQRLKVSTYEEMISWLQANVADFTIGEESFKVSLEPDKADALLYHYSITEPGKKEPLTTDYYFNLADLDPYTVSLNVQGKTLHVDVETQRDQRFVTARENGEMKNYQDKVSFRVGEVDKGRDLAEVLRLALTEAEKRRTTQLATNDDMAANLNAFQAALPNFELAGDKFSQTFEGGCTATYRMQETDDKGEVSEESYELHLGDLAANQVSIKVSGKNIFVVGEIKNKDKFIKSFQDGAQKNYVATVEFRAEGVENAKNMAFLLKQAAEQCDQNRDLALPATAGNALISWIMEQVDGFKDPDASEYEQHLTIDEEQCLLHFSSVEPKGKSYQKMKYEVFLKELNKEALKPVVSGKTMAVQLSTIYNEKHIKSYKNDEVEKYTDKLEMHVPGIQEARMLVLGLGHLLEGCKE